MSVTLTTGRMCELLHHKLSSGEVAVSMLTLTAVHAFLLSMMALQHETVCVCVRYAVARATPWPAHTHCFVFGVTSRIQLQLMM